jgi:WD40 repeat protein
VLEGHRNWVRSLDFSPDSQFLLSGGYDRTIRIWDIKTQSQIGDALTEHTGIVWDVKYSPDAKSIASASADGTVILRDASTGQAYSAIPTLIGHTDDVFAVTFAPDGETLISASEDQTVIVWAAEARNPLITEKYVYPELEFKEIAASPDGNWRAIGGWSAGAKGPLLLQSTDKIVEIVEEGSEIMSVVWHPESTDFVYSTALGHVARVEISNLEIETLIEPSGIPIRDIDFSHDGRQLAIGDETGQVRLFDIESAEEKLIGQHDGRVTALAFNHDDSLLVSGDKDGMLIVWNVHDATEQDVLEGIHSQDITEIVFSHDGQNMATSSWDNQVIVWTTSDWQARSPILQGHTDWVLDVAFSANGKFLISSSSDHSLILVDVVNLEPIGQPFTTHSNEVWSVDFLPQSDTVTSVDTDGNIIVWNLNVDDWRKLACHIVNRNLTANEYQQYQIDESSISPCIPA